MTTEKIIGYTMLGVGILLMIFSSFQIILTFTGKAQAIKIFESAPKENLQNDTNALDMSNPDQLLQQVQQDPFSLLTSGGSGAGFPQIIDPTVINQMLNLMVYYFIMQFLLGLGYKLASLGVQMVRPLKISIDKSQLTSLLESGKTDIS